MILDTVRVCEAYRRVETSKGYVLDEYRTRLVFTSGLRHGSRTDRLLQEDRSTFVRRVKVRPKTIASDLCG